MFIHRILELPWFIFIFAHHITINFFENILCIHSGVIFGTNCNILILTLFSSVFPMSLTFICCTSALQHLKPYLWVQPFGGLSAHCKLTTNCLCLVFYILILLLLFVASCSYSMWNNVQNQLQTCSCLWEVFIIVIRWCTRYWCTISRGRNTLLSEDFIF